MIEKILNLGTLKELKFNNKEFKKINCDLEQIGFFSDEEEEYNEVFTILRRSPEEKDKLNGQYYILVDCFEGKKIIKSKIYDFNLKVTSTCS